MEMWTQFLRLKRLNQRLTRNSPVPKSHFEMSGLRLSRSFLSPFEDGMRNDRRGGVTSEVAYLWLYQLGDDSPDGVATSLAKQRDRYNLPSFLYRRVGANELAGYARQSTNEFLKREGSKILTLKELGGGLRRTTLELATFP
jgi:hypothetical protein